MKTEDLITKLSADSGRHSWSPGALLLATFVVGTVYVAVLLLTTMGPRPDFVQALTTWRFDFKFVVTLTVAATAYGVLRRALFPVGGERLPVWLLLAGPAILLCGVAVELASIPGAGWAMASTGKNALLCLTVVPLLGGAPLVAFIWVLRQGAAMRPTLGGLAAGLLAGGIAATFYAANCTDDSPLFVATWYPISILGLGIVGAVLGRIAARW